MAVISRRRKRLGARSKLEDLIRTQRLWGQQLLGERELAEEIGVSRGTLRSTLAELEAEGVLVRRAGEGTFVAERPSAKARPKTVRLAVIAEEHYERASGWRLYKEMIKGLLGLAPRLLVEPTVLALDRPKERARVLDAESMREFRGFVALGLDQREILSHLLGLRRGPVVLLDHFMRDLPITSVVDGSFEGARMVTRHLLTLGHRRIAFVDCANRDAVNPERFAGYKTALFEKGLPVDSTLVTERSRSLFEPENSRRVDELVGSFLDLEDPPTAFFCFNDRRAVALVKALGRRGLAIGKDISVASCGDTAIRMGLCDRLTNCRLYPRKMGRLALRAALEPAGRAESRTMIVANRLIVRESTGPLARNRVGASRTGRRA